MALPCSMFSEKERGDIKYCFLVRYPFTKLVKSSVLINTKPTLLGFVLFIPINESGSIKRRNAWSFRSFVKYFSES